MSGTFRIKVFSRDMVREGFDCGDWALNRYLLTQLSQDVRRKVANAFFALDSTGRLAGYYTLSAYSVSLPDLPQDEQKKLPRYPTVPCVLLGRLAVDLRFTGQGLGSALLVDALHRSLQSDIAAFAMVADAKNNASASFYQHHGFIRLPDTANTWFYPLASLPENMPNRPA